CTRADRWQDVTDRYLWRGRTFPFRLTRPPIDPRYARRLYLGLGALFIVAGAFLFAATGLQLWLYSQASQGQANAGFQAISRQPVTGTTFANAATTFVYGIRSRFGYTVDDVSFIATREEPTCNPSLSSCAPDPASAPVRQWDGNLTWTERAGPRFSRS